MVWLGCKRLGYDEPAAELAARVSGAIAAQGLREYYDPHTGAGMGAVNFGWSSLAMELIEPDDRACSSYLESPSALP
jgi:hypothetical protein